MTLPVNFKAQAVVALALSLRLAACQCHWQWPSATGTASGSEHRDGPGKTVNAIGSVFLKCTARVIIAHGLTTVPLVLTQNT